MYNIHPSILSVIYIHASLYHICAHPALTHSLTHSQGDRILGRLDFVRVRDAALLPDLVHRLHDNDALVPAHGGAFQSALSTGTREDDSLAVLFSLLLLLFRHGGGEEGGKHVSKTVEKERWRERKRKRKKKSPHSHP